MKVKNQFYMLIPSQTNLKTKYILHVKSYLYIGCDEDYDCNEGEVCKDNRECGKYSLCTIENK